MIKQLHELKPWDKNARTITKEGLKRLETQLRTFGQYKPFLITADGTILGGNMRYRALQNIGIGEVECTVVGFLAEEEGIAVQIGDVIHREKFFKTVEDAMMELSLSDNDRAGQYDAEMLDNIKSEFNVDWNNYAVDFTPPQSISDFVNSVAPENGEPEKKQSKEPETIICPHCKAEFTLPKNTP